MRKPSVWSSPYAVLLCLVVVALADLAIWRVHMPYLVEAISDEPAHAATGLLVLLAVCVLVALAVVGVADRRVAATPTDSAV